jgi:hypothetical protein
LPTSGVEVEAVDEIDLIVLASSTPDMIFPSTACLLQRKLGVAHGTAFDVQAACTGFLYAAAIADKFVASGQCKCARVVGTDVFSRLLDWSDRRTCVLFGDGASPGRCLQRGTGRKRTGWQRRRTGHRMHRVNCRTAGVIVSATRRCECLPVVE